METKTIAFFLIIIATYAMVGCEMQQNSKDYQKKDVGIRPLREDMFYQIQHLTDSTYKICWGRGIDTFVTSATFEFAAGKSLEYLTSNDSAIVMTQHSGINCSNYVFLPLLRSGIEKSYLCCKALDIDNNLVAYDPGDNTSLLIIENYLNGKQKPLKEQNICPAAVSSDCIDSCFFTKDNKFVLYWQGSNWSAKRKDGQMKVYSNGF